MKKIMLGILTLASAGTLISCGNSFANSSGGEGSSSQNNVPTLNEEQTYLAQTVLSLDLLSTSSPISFRASSLPLSSALPSLEEEIANEILDSASSLSSLLSFSPSEIVTLESDREEYETCYQISLNHFDESKETYTMYLNEETREEQDDDELETITTLHGLAIKDGIEYSIRGTRSEEIEGRESETELELIIAQDAQNFVTIEQSLENGENEYEYSLTKNGRLVKEEEYEFETLRNGKIVVSLEREAEGKEIEIDLYAEGNTIKRAAFEVEVSGDREYEGFLTISPQEDGTTLYQVTFKHSENTYEKII